MSGYLQRMAATALRPKGRVHPFVETMYGAPRSADAQLETATGRVVEPAQRLGGTARRVEPPTVRGAAAKAERPAGESSPRESYQPLLPETAGSSPAFGFAEHATPAVTSSAHRKTVPKDAASEPQRLNRRSDDQGAESEWSFEPLMGEVARAASGAASNFVPSAHDTEADANRQRASSGFAELASQRLDPSPNSDQPVQPASGLRSAAKIAAGRRLAQQQQARERAEQHGDEIQIHIGRIEVIAMPPPAPRPIPVPVRKSQTLDEYLRRGSGRAG
jgi:hypothetical protein